MWMEVAANVYVRRWQEMDQSLGLIVGDQQCLVIDTGSDLVQAKRWAELVREVTPLPWQVVITHAHFDHCFGTAAFLPCRVWATPACRTDLIETGVMQRDIWVEHYRKTDRAELADRLAAVEPVIPDHLVDGEVAIDLGGRTVRLIAVPKAHTDHDLIAYVPDAGITFAGDLVEQGAPPSFGDAWPATWPAAVDAILATGATTIVPGHGTPVDRDFVAAQGKELTTVAALAAAVVAGTIDRDDAVRRSPYPENVTDDAIARQTETHD